MPPTQNPQELHSQSFIELAPENILRQTGNPAIVSREERSLTAREREVVKLLAEGKTVRATASILGLSSKTVDAHKFNLMRKLNIHNKAALVLWAVREKVVKISA